MFFRWRGVRVAVALAYEAVFTKYRCGKTTGPLNEASNASSTPP